MRFEGDLLFFSAGIFGNSLGTFSHGMTDQLSRQKQTNRSLDVSRNQGVRLPVFGELASLAGDPVEDVAYERIHDGHAPGSDSDVGMNLRTRIVQIFQISAIRF